MPASWLFVVVLVSVLSRVALSLASGPVAEYSPSPMVGKPRASGALIAESRNPEKTVIWFAGAQGNRPLRNRPHPPINPGAISFPSSDASDNKRFERKRRQLGFFDPQPPRRPNNPNRPKNVGGSGTISFPSDPPAWGNNFNTPRPNRPRPWGQKPSPPPQPPRPFDDRFVFGNGPPMRTTTMRARVTRATTRRPITVEQPAVTRPTPASTRAGCNCPSTPEFNPVCGEDRVTYSNAGKLKCANYCGNPVKMVHMGSCISTTTPPPTPPPLVSPPTPPPPPPPPRPLVTRGPPQWNWT